jgi:hypothetical protein
VAYNNKAFTLSHCWTVVKDSKNGKIVLPFGKSSNKKGKGNANASTGNVIDLDAQVCCLGNLEGEGLAAAGGKRRSPGHKATKANIA